MVVGYARKGERKAAIPVGPSRASSLQQRVGGEQGYIVGEEGLGAIRFFDS